MFLYSVIVVTYNDDISPPKANMYVIYDKGTGQKICGGAHLTTPKKAWTYFEVHFFKMLRERPDGTTMSLLKGARHYSNFFECKLEGTRAPVLKVPGHKLTVTWNGEHGKESGSTGTCTCGWTESCNSRGAVNTEFRNHLARISAADLAPKPPAHQSPTARAEQSLARLREEGGDRKTFRLGPESIKALSAAVQANEFPNESAAVDAALKNLRRTPVSTASCYPRHVDTPEVCDVIEESVRLACRELDQLFPGAAPDGGQGVSSNFQGLLVEHVRAMLTGKNHAQRSHHTELPVLLADDGVFGAPFSLPDIPGAGYMVVWPKENSILSAYSGRFLGAMQKPFKLLETWRSLPLFEDHAVDGISRHSRPHLWAGRDIYFQSSDVDVLFSSHEAAVAAALKALDARGESPQKAALDIVGAVLTDEDNVYRFL